MARRSRLTYNVHGQNIPDVGRLKSHLLKINPFHLLAMDNLGFLREMMVDLKDTIMIHRNYGITNGDDDVHIKVTPARWLELRAKESEGGIYLYTTNEPAFDQKSIQWHIELMELAAKQGVKLVIGNWAVGNPGPDDWGQAKRMLELLDQNRDLFVLGLHEYACGIITSGLYGGYPNNAGVQPGTPGGQDLVPKDKWPKDVSKITQWHCGRFNFLVNYCQKNNIKPPRIIITEHGFDDVSDIKGWAEKLEKTQNYSSIRGWKSLRSQWDKWFNPIGWSAERGYFEQLVWADQTIYQNSVVEGQCVYCWGHSSEIWEQFDVSEAYEFQGRLEDYAKAVDVPIVNTKPIPMPKPLDASNPRQQTLVSTNVGRIVRAGAGIDYKPYTTIKNGDVLTVYDPIKKDGQGMRWVWIESSMVNGWLCIDGISFGPPPISTPIPSPTVPPTSTLPPEPPPAPDDTPVPPIIPVEFIQYDYAVKLSVYAKDRDTADRMVTLFGTIVKQSPTLLAVLADAIVRADCVKSVDFDVQLPK